MYVEHFFRKAIAIVAEGICDAETVDAVVKGNLGSNFTWSALGIGKGHLPIIYAALAMGGNVRVGMEDNIFYRKGQLAKSNVEFVDRVKRYVTEIKKLLLRLMRHARSWVLT